MKILLTTTTALFALAAPAFADSDAAEGEKDYKKCKSCHMIVAPDGTEIQKGGKTGPNLYGVIGRVAGSEEGFKYDKGLQDANAAGFVWTEEAMAAYVADPKAWLGEQGWTAKTKMTFKLKDGGDDVAAYLASVAPAAE